MQDLPLTFLETVPEKMFWICQNLFQYLKGQYRHDQQGMESEC